MSGIYIPGMSMPKENEVICIFPDKKTQKRIVKFSSLYEVLETSRAVPVPDHGRLIDADALSDMLDKYEREYALEAGDKKDFGIMQKAFGLHDAELMAESLPTIIPADKEEDS